MTSNIVTKLIPLRNKGSVGYFGHEIFYITERHIRLLYSLATYMTDLHNTHYLCITHRHTQHSWGCCLSNT